MSKQEAITKLGDFVNENLPHILTGVAAVGVITTAVESSKAVLKVKAMDNDEQDDRKPSDKAKDIAKVFVIPVVSGALTIGCIVSSDVVHTKRYTSLLGAFMLTKGELEKHKDDIKQLLGTEKAAELEHKIAEKRVEDFDKHKASRYLEESKYVKHKVVDQVTGATFKASYADLLRGETEVAKEIARSGHATLEWFYETVTEEVDYPEIATRIYWDQEDKYDTMNIHIGGEVSPDGEMYYTIDYEFNIR